MSITIYHNPACGTSRNTLAMIRQSGEEPQIIEYLKTPPTRERLQDLIVAMGVPVRALLREKGTPYHELGLADPKWSDDELIDFMLAHPILINRPIVVTPKGIKLCRPSEAVRDILPQPNHRALHKRGWRSRDRRQREAPQVKAGAITTRLHACRRAGGNSWPLNAANSPPFLRTWFIQHPKTFEAFYEPGHMRF